jgi:hypothetical protein
MIEDLIEKMQYELSHRREGHVHRFEDHLAKVADLRDPDHIGRLLPLFDDETEFDEVMFSIIHTMENCTGAAYVREILNYLESFFAHSTRWTVVISMRIMNSPAAMAAFAHEIGSLTAKQKLAVRNVLESVRSKNAKFFDQCDSLLTVL